jgi:hypothetical protein
MRMKQLSGMDNVFLRLERRDVSKAALRRNPQGIVMPEVLG